MTPLARRLRDQASSRSQGPTGARDPPGGPGTPGLGPCPWPRNPGPSLARCPRPPSLGALLKPALLCGALAAPGLAGTMCASRDDWRCARSMHEFSAKDIDGRMVCLDKYRGFVCIVTNVASQ